MKKKRLMILAVLCLVFAIPLLVWGFWPPRRETVTVPLVLPAGMPSLPETRLIRLTFSPSMRAGDSQIVELNVLADGDAAGGDGYENFNVIVEARLDLPFTDIRPADVVSSALVKGGGATFYWDVSPRQEGDWNGTAWVYLRLIPKVGSPAGEIRQPVLAQLVEVRSRSMLGRTGAQARLIGVSVGIFGLGMGIPWLWSRRKRQ